MGDQTASLRSKAEALALSVWKDHARMVHPSPEALAVLTDCCLAGMRAGSGEPVAAKVAEPSDSGPAFAFYSGPWECSEAPTIVRADPEGGDPHILATIARIHHPQALHELCRLANERLAVPS